MKVTITRNELDQEVDTVGSLPVGTVFKVACNRSNLNVLILIKTNESKPCAVICFVLRDGDDETFFANLIEVDKFTEIKVIKSSTVSINIP